MGLNTMPICGSKWGDEGIKGVFDGLYGWV